MKKFVLSLLSVFVILSFVSCGSDPETEGDDPSAPVVSNPEESYDNESILDVIENARDLAIEADAEYYAPTYFDSLDEFYDELYERYENGENIVKDGKNLADAYLSLAYYLQACELKEEIDETEMQYLAQSLYDQGCADLETIEEMLESENVTSAQVLAKATSAKTCFETVINTIYKQLAVEQRQIALESKRDADSVKAAVSMKEDYNEAVQLFKEGDSSYSRQQTKDAYDYYVEASEYFADIYDEVSEKRAYAERAIEEAKQRVKESQDFAESADEKAPITESMDGIEEEDAVLLQDDVYEDPDEAQIDLPEYIDAAVEEVSEELSLGDAK